MGRVRRVKAVIQYQFAKIRKATFAKKWLPPNIFW